MENFREKMISNNEFQEKYFYNYGNFRQINARSISKSKSLLPLESLNIDAIRISENETLTQKELESLYIELLYTVRHRVGQTLGEHSSAILDIVRYAKAVFDISDHDHNWLYAESSEAKPPIVVLNVHIIQCRDLEAKDSDGYSDPYCILGIIPGRQIKGSITSILPSASAGIISMQQSSRESLVQPSPQAVQYLQEPEPTGFKSRTARSSIKRFGQNLYRRVNGSGQVGVNSASGSANSSQTQSPNQSFRVGNTLKTNDTSSQTHILDIKAMPNISIDSQIPVRFMRATHVKENTVSPVWDEHFRFDLEDPSLDWLHLDIWDHDDETSVLDAVTRLNHVKGVKGLSRYFKQVGQSARMAGSGKEVDDFLGCVTIPLADIPSNGIEKWFKLSGRTFKSKMQGEIQLSLSLSTREDRGIAEEDNWSDLQQHQALLCVFLTYDLNNLKVPLNEWDGKLSKAAETILHQHAIQGDMTEIQIALCRWIAYSRKHREFGFDYEILRNLIKILVELWKPNSLNQEEMNWLSSSFTLFTECSMRLLVNIFELFHEENCSDMARLTNIFKCLKTLHGSGLYQFCSPFANALQSELNTTFRKCATKRYQKVKELHLANNANLLQINTIRKYSKILVHLVEDIKRAQNEYEKIISQFFDVSLAKSLYKIFIIEVKNDLITKDLLNEWSLCCKHRHKCSLLCQDEENILSSLRMVNESTYGLYNKSFNQQTDSSYRIFPWMSSDNSDAEQYIEYLNLIYELFALFINLFTLIRLKGKLDPERELSELDQINFHGWFMPVLDEWIDNSVVQLISGFVKDLMVEKFQNSTQSEPFSTSFVKEEVHEKKEQFDENFVPFEDVPEETFDDRFTLKSIPGCSWSVIQFVYNLQWFIDAWHLVAWPDRSTILSYTIRISKVISASGVIYAERLQEKLRLSGFCDDRGSFEITKELCISLNNIDLILSRITSLPQALHWDQLHSTLVTAKGASGNCSPDGPTPGFWSQNDSIIPSLYRLHAELTSSIGNKMIHIMQRVVAKMRPEIHKSMFNLSWSSSAIPCNKALSELFIYLDTSISRITTELFKTNQKTFLKVLWNEIMDEFREQVFKEIDEGLCKGGPGMVLPMKFFSTRNTTYAQQVHQLAENGTDVDCTMKVRSVLIRILQALSQVSLFFVSTSRAELNRSELETHVWYTDIKYLIEISLSSTTDVVEQYFLEKLREQELKKDSSNYGQITINIGFIQGILHVEVVNAANLIPLDSNGLSDPFVLVEVQPKHIYSTLKYYKTKVARNTLDPKFHEKFEFEIDLNEINENPSTCLCLIVYDKDFMMSDDFEGCAFVSLNEVFFQNQNIQKLTYNLIHPKYAERKALSILGLRTTDPYAQEVYKKWRQLESS